MLVREVGLGLTHVVRLCQDLEREVEEGGQGHDGAEDAKDDAKQVDNQAVGNHPAEGGGEGMAEGGAWQRV